MTEITIDRPTVKLKIMPELQKRRLVRKLLEEPEYLPAECSFAHRPDAEFWPYLQTVRPIHRKKKDWRNRLVNVFDTWAGKAYTPGEFGCFLFACQCLDAMTGSRFYDRHNKKWNSVAGFYPYCRAVAGLDYFDCIGHRALPHAAEPGDLVQHEAEMNGRLHVHWSIVAEEPNTCVSFTVTDLVEQKIVDQLLPQVTARIWKLNSPINCNDIQEN